MWEYFRAKWRLLCLFSYKSFFTAHAILKIKEYPRLVLGNIRSHDVYRLIALERKHLMNYKPE